ncbi:Uncharacterised protein [Pannonibacter phragmitetus]|uniref:Uncharacterized protein n=1 Tax=Pannonibacter phragmitetus TaxID=121719 RepID=A0A378ZVF7_9HYPH|nr:hypothetical protein [Pannonibacter phragmitetus]SUB00839.1 Uncharacterised protein [Pannonibacter phragmitetus]
MARDYSTATMTRLVKDCTASRNSRNGYLEHGSTKEIYRRLPIDLRRWFALIMYEIGDPLTLRGGHGRSDDDYFEHWRGKRDRYHPETHPDYKPPSRGRKRDDDDDNDEGDGGSPVSPPGP